MKNKMVFTIFNANTYFHLVLEMDNDSNQETDRMNTQEVGNEMDKTDIEEVTSSPSNEEAKGRQSVTQMK